MRFRRDPTRTLRAALACAALVLGWTAPAPAQMPDVRSMSGLAIPAPDLPNGTVTVRVVRGEITNNLPGVPVELHGAGAPRTTMTGPDGRAEFRGLPPGATVHALAVVDGERIESSEFQIPAQGGIRTLLAAGGGAPGAAAAAPPAAQGPGATMPPAGKDAPALRIGPNSRIAVEFSEDVLQVFYLLEIVNASGAPVNPAPLTLDMPGDARGTTVLEGSTRLATAEGIRVIVNGPFPTGVTPLQVAFRLEESGDSLTLRQAFPLPMDMPTVAVQKVGDMRVSSPQVSRLQEVPIQNNTFLMGTGPALPAGTPIELSITGLPHHDRTALWLSLALVIAIVGAGVWLAVTPARRDGAEAVRAALQKRRDQGLAALGALERDRRNGIVGEERYVARRGELVAGLERVYAALDEHGGEAATRDVA